MTFYDKIVLAESTIKLALSLSKNPCVACSLGKDSVLTVFLVRQFYAAVPVIFVNSGAEMPDVEDFKNLLIDKYKINIIEVPALHSPQWTFARHGWPKTLSREGNLPLHYCNVYAKARPLKYAFRRRGHDLMFDGLRRESKLRNYWLKKKGLLNYYRELKGLRCHPVAEFTTKEVYLLHDKLSIPMHPVYKQKMEGYDARLGCWCCPVAFTKKRLEWLEKYYPSVVDNLKKINFPFDLYL